MELGQIEQEIQNADLYTYLGKIDKIVGTTVESMGPVCRLGDVCTIDVVEGTNPVRAEVVGFRENRVLLMPYEEMEGIGYGSAVRNTGGTSQDCCFQQTHRQDRGRHGHAH